MKEQDLFVLDASVALSWVFEDESTGYTEEVLESLSSNEAIAPVSWPLEVGNGLLVAERRGRLTHADTVQFLDLLSRLPVHLETAGMKSMLGEIMELARKERLSTYDASYLDIAMRLGLSLATKDRALSEAASRCGVKIFKYPG